MTRLLLLVISALGIGLTHHAMGPEIRFPAEIGPKGSPLPEGMISVSAAAKLHADGLPFVDASLLSEHEDLRIPGSLHLEIDAFRNGAYPEALHQLDRSVGLVVYCHGGCDAAQLVALRLRDLGYEHCLVLAEGLQAWRDAGHEVESGARR